MQFILRNEKKYEGLVNQIKNSPLPLKKGSEEKLIFLTPKQVWPIG